MAILFGSPVAALLGGNALRRMLGAPARIGLGLGALAVLSVACTPVSLPGVVADHIVIGLAYAALWLSIGSSFSIVRYAAVATFAVFVAVVFVARWPVLPLVWVSGDLTRMPFKTLQPGCDLAVRMVNYGWVAHSGTEVVILSRRFGLPVEIELGRQRFDDTQYEPAGLSARAVGEGVNCSAVVTYEGTELWRMP